MTIRAGRWLRVSTGAQDEASQEPSIDDWCKQHGYEVAETYRVHGQSAYHGKHEPELRKAMADLKAGKIEVLVAWKSDRLERRGARALMGLIAEAAESGGRIEFTTEPGLNGISDPIAGPLLQAFYGAVAQHESSTKGDRIRAKQAALRAAGSFASGFAPFGFRIAVAEDGRKTLEPDPDEAPAVKRIFREVAGGATPGQLARALTIDGVPTRRGLATWSDRTVGQIIANPVYRGLVQHRGVTYMTIDPLVPVADWLNANQAVKARYQSKGHGSRGRPMASALLRPDCGKCGGPMYRWGRYYRCAKGCGNTITMAVLDAEVTAEFLADDEPEVIETVVPGKDYAEDIAAAQLAIRDLDVLADDYDDRHAALVAEVRRLKALPVEPEKRTAVYTGRTEGEAFKDMTPDERRAFIRLWKLTVWPKDSEHQTALVAALNGRRWTLARKS
jgi:DNA invertase Pin-like site-specific DNA recombinase